MEKKKKKSFIGVILRIILILLLVAILLVAGLFVYLKSSMAKMPLSLDNIAECAAAPARSTAEYLAFTPEGEMSLTLDKNDVCFFLLNHFGEDWQADLNKNLALTGISVEGVGLSLKEDGVSIDFEGRWRNSRLAGRVSGQAVSKENSIVFRPETIQLGKLKISTEKLLNIVSGKAGISPEDLTIEYEPELVFFQSISTVQSGNGTLTISGPMGWNYLSLTGKSKEEVGRMSMMQDCCSLAGPVLYSFHQRSDNCFAGLLPRLCDDPALFKDFLRQYFTILPPSVLEKAEFFEKNGGLLRRWWGEYPKEDHAAEHQELENQYKFGVKFFDGIVYKLTEAYYEKNIRIKKGQFYLKNELFSTERIYGENLLVPYSDCQIYLNLDENMFLCLVTDESFHDDRIPKLSQVLDSAASVPEELDTNGYYPIGLVSRGRDGNAYITVRTFSNWSYNFYLLPISGEEYETLANAELIPVWSGKA